MREAQVYLRAKALLLRSGWQVIAGQPPRGTDHLPVVEIKDPTNLAKGSRGAFKPDFIASLDTWLLIGECKPIFDLADVFKLAGILSAPHRIAALAAELRGRRILDKDFVPVGVVAHAGGPWLEPLPVGQLAFSSEAHIIVPGKGWTDLLVSSFSGHEEG